MIEFDCCECRRHIVAIVLDKPPDPPLCGDCFYIPSWHEDPAMVARLHPGYRKENPNGCDRN